MTSPRPRSNSSVRRRSRVGLAGAAALVLMLGACGADGTSSEGGSATTTAKPAATSTSLATTTTTTGPSTTTIGPSTTVDTTPPAPTPTTAPADSGGGSGDGGSGGGSGGAGGGENVPLTAEQAAATIRTKGDWDPDMGTYDPRASLSGVIGTASGAGSSAAPQQIFLFAYGQYLGTATSTPRAGISIDTGESGAVKANYSHWAEADPFCCPSLAPWKVTFRINSAGKVVPEGELPPEDQFG